MAWIESHQDLGQHPKTFELATALNADIITAIGVLHLLWHFTLKFAWRDGDLSKFQPHIIAHSIGWTKEPASLIKALQISGWLDDMVVHDWLDYAGKIVRDRIYNEERRNTPLNAVSCRKTAATVPNPTVPNLTQPTSIAASRQKHFQKPSAQEVKDYAKTLSFDLDGDKFVDYYESKGWKIGNAPMKDWKAAVRTWKRNGYSNGGTNNATNGSKGLSVKDAIRRHQERTAELRKVSSPREILAGIRVMPEIPPEA